MLALNFAFVFIYICFRLFGSLLFTILCALYAGPVVFTGAGSLCFKVLGCFRFSLARLLGHVFGREQSELAFATRHSQRPVGSAREGMPMRRSEG